MNYRESLIRRARHYWFKGLDIPLNLHIAMQNEGLIVSEIRRYYEV
jgi:hypothetical protein